MNQALPVSRYIFQQVFNPLGAVEPPQGYRLHSWREMVVGGFPPSETLVVILCWEREPSMTSNALAQLPAEWVTPGLEFIKRWVLKHT